MFAFLQCLLNICSKFEFLNSQGSVATCLRCVGYYLMGFVANFIRFPAVQTFWKSVKIWQTCREFKGGEFFETQCSNAVLPLLQISQPHNVYGNSFPIYGKVESFMRIWRTLRIVIGRAIHIKVAQKIFYCVIFPAFRVSDAGGKMKFSKVKSGTVGKADFKTQVGIICFSLLSRDRKYTTTNFAIVGL